MMVLRKLVAIINLVVGLPITFFLFPVFLLTLIGFHTESAVQVNDWDSFFLVVGAGVSGFAGGFHLLRNRKQFYGFLTISGILWSALVLLMVKQSVSADFIFWVALLANINLIFVACYLRLRKE